MKRLSSLVILLLFLAVPFLQATSLEGAIYCQGNQLSVSGTEAAGKVATGQEMYKAYKADLVDPAKGLFKEFRLPSGKRIDFLDTSGTVFEYKPFNPRAMRAGERQLDMYINELQSMPEFKGIDWKKVLDTY